MLLFSPIMSLYSAFTETPVDYKEAVAFSADDVVYLSDIVVLYTAAALIYVNDAAGAAGAFST